ncbi:MAG TPA: GTP-binding protein, partial [Thermoanaerobaculia bacterium]|nr:GTP-binding protein [Thermoanaerobaculia bacterium]
MQVESPEKIRNVAIAGHNDTGKTTLVSALLYAGGVTTRLNRIEDGNTLTDFDHEEVVRKISIGLAACFVPWRQHKVNLVDCPGYGIFFTETRQGMRAADSVLLTINAVAGVEVNTEKVWSYAEEIGLPTMLHLSKMDRERADFGRAVEGLQKSFGRGVLPIQIPIGSEAGFTGLLDLVQGRLYRFTRDGNGKAEPADMPADLPDEIKAEAGRLRAQLVEAVAETDDKLMEGFFENGSLEQADLESGLRRAIARRQIFPVVVGAEGHGIGSASLLDALVALLPSPADRPGFPASNVGGEPVTLTADPAAPVAALAFKTLSDPFSGKISILRVVSGTLHSDSAAYNSRTEENERLGHLLTLQGKTGTHVPHLIAGDIGGVAKLKSTHSGDTLCARERPVKIDWITVPEAAMAFAVEPKSKVDEEKIGEALTRLMDEDLNLKAS